MKLIEKSDTSFIFKFNNISSQEFHSILPRIKAVPGIRFNPGAKLWQVAISQTSALEVVQVAEAHNFEITSEVRDTLEKVASVSIELIQLAMGEKEVTDNFGLLQEMRPYQKVAARYGMLAGNFLLGDQRGVGKTHPVIAIVNHQKLYPVLVITTKRGKFHWYRLWQQLTGDRSVSLWESGKTGRSKVNIIHYDMAGKVKDYIVNYLKPVCVILDESHKIADPSTARFKAVEEICKGADRVIGLTGTAVVNKMRDLAVQLRMLKRIDLFGGQFKFLQRYTNATEEKIYLRGGGGASRKVWKFEGVRNEREMYQILRANCFIGRKRREVEKDLPPVTMEEVEMEISSEQYRLVKEQTIRKLHEAKERLDTVRPGTLAESSILEDAESNIFRWRREHGEAKIPAIKEWLFEWLEEDDKEKIVLFAHHKEVQAAIASWFPNGAVIRAGQTEIESQSNIDRFQRDPGCRTIVCSDEIAQEAITLTAASYMAICEQPWTEKAREQMIGRIDRFGQEKPVMVYNLIDPEENSLDRIMLGIIAAKAHMGKINSTKYFIEILTK